MALNFIGIGLGNAKDISIKGLELVKSSDFIYLEYYTSKLADSIESIEKLYGKKIIIADRNIVENEAENTILKNAKDSEVSFLVIGDVFSATTHVDLMIRAKKNNIPVKIVHNASVLTAVGITGLELYKFGKITSIPFHNENVVSPIKVFENNKENGLHTLFLFDLNPLEDRFMSFSEAIRYLIKNGVSDSLKGVACCGLGRDNAFIKYAGLKELLDMKSDLFPQCLIIPGKLHFMEEECLEYYG